MCEVHPERRSPVETFEWGPVGAAMCRMAETKSMIRPDLETLVGGVRELVRRKLGSKQCDLWTFWRVQCGYSDTEIHAHLWLGCPSSYDNRANAWNGSQLAPLILLWSETIALALLRKDDNRCQCFEAYHDYRSKKYTHMTKSCERNHWIGALPAWLSDATENGDNTKAFEGSVEAKFLKRAVDGDSNLHKRQGGVYRAFGNSMLCAVSQTPGESRLMLTDEDKLIDERSLVNATLEGSVGANLCDHRIGAINGDIVWVCHRCRAIVGREGKICKNEGCYWQPFIVPDAESGEPTTYVGAVTFTTSLARCRNGHCWPKRGQHTCPAPGCGQSILDKRVQVIGRYRDIRYDDVV